MLPLFAAVLFIFTDAVQASEECDEHPYSMCDFERPTSFPESEEEFDNLCQGAIAHLECLIDFRERCGADSYFQEVANAELSSIRDVCDKDKILNAVVVENLQCYKEIFDDRELSEICFEDPGLERQEQYAQGIIEASNEGFEGNENGTLRCVGAVYLVACYSLQVKKQCGDTAMDAYIEVIRKSIGAAFECGDEIAEALPTIVEVMIREDELAEDIGQALKKKK